MKNKLFYLKIAIAIFLVTYLIRSIGLLKLYETIISGNVLYFFLSCSIVPIFFFLKTLKWHLMVRRAGSKEDFLTSLHSMLGGLAFGLFTPGRVGEIMRAKYYSSLDKIMVGGLVVLDRLIDLLTVLILGTYFVADKFGILPSMIIFITTISLLLLLVRLTSMYKLMSVIQTPDRLHQFFVRLGGCSRVLAPVEILKYSGLSLLNWLFVVIQFYLIINMYHTCRLKIAIATLPVIQLTNILPITISGIGVREYLSVFVMRTYSIPDQVSAIGAFFLYLIDGLIPGVVGLILLGLERNR